MGIHRREKKKETLFEKAQVCGICKKPIAYKEANLDHIQPRSLGGGNELSNLQLAHFKCNSEKGNSHTKP